VSLLLDTHVILWWLTDDPALSDEIKTRLDDEPDVYVSPASLWEVAIKQSIGKLSGPIDLAEEIGNSGFREVPITFRHAIAAGRHLAVLELPLEDDLPVTGRQLADGQLAGGCDLAGQRGDLRRATSGSDHRQQQGDASES